MDGGGFRGGAKAYDKAVDEYLAGDRPVTSSTCERESGGPHTAAVTLTSWMEGSGTTTSIFPIRRDLGVGNLA